MQEILAAHGLMFDADVLKKLNLYHEMLLDWNTRMDLTSVSEDAMATRHFVDSLIALTVPGLLPEGARMIDVGTGAGFPGLPLAIARPDMQVCLMDAQGKRCTFLRAVAEALALQNVSVVQARAEDSARDVQHREKYALATARAVAPLNVLCEYLLPFVKVGGQALCWKGPAVMDELAAAKKAAHLLGGKLGDVLDMPLPDARHVLVCLHKNIPIARQYPRKNGMPAKHPLGSDKIGI